MERNEIEELVRNFAAERFFPENGASGKLRCFMEILRVFAMNLYEKTGCDVREGSLPYFSLLLLIWHNIEQYNWNTWFYL